MTVIRILTLIGVLGLGLLAFQILNRIKNLDTTLSLDPNISLQEVLTSLREAAKLASGVAEDLKLNVAESRQQFTRLVVLLDRMQMDLTASGESSARTEASGKRAERDRAVVAQDLAEVQEHARRIEAEPASPTGAAADFAAGGNNRLQPPEAKKIKPRKARPPKSAP